MKLGCGEPTRRMDILSHADGGARLMPAPEPHGSSLALRGRGATIASDPWSARSAPSARGEDGAQARIVCSERGVEGLHVAIGRSGASRDQGGDRTSEYTYAPGHHLQERGVVGGVTVPARVATARPGAPKASNQGSAPGESCSRHSREALPRKLGSSRGPLRHLLGRTLLWRAEPVVVSGARRLIPLGPRARIDACFLSFPLPCPLCKDCRTW